MDVVVAMVVVVVVVGVNVKVLVVVEGLVLLRIFSNLQSWDESVDLRLDTRAKR